MTLCWIVLMIWVGGFIWLAFLLKPSDFKKDPSEKEIAELQIRHPHLTREEIIDFLQKY